MIEGMVDIPISAIQIGLDVIRWIDKCHLCRVLSEKLNDISALDALDISHICHPQSLNRCRCKTLLS